MTTPTTDYALWKQLILAAIICTGSIAYVVRQIKSGKRAGKPWREILTDGYKPMTGNIWGDAAILMILVFGTFAAIAYAFSRL